MTVRVSPHHLLRERRGYNRAAAAVANKNTRIIWAALRTGEPYRVTD